jgi:hypothetical protein
MVEEVFAIKFSQFIISSFPSFSLQQWMPPRVWALALFRERLSWFDYHHLNIALEMNDFNRRVQIEPASRAGNIHAHKWGHIQRIVEK